MPETFTLASLDLNEINLLLKGLGKLPAEESFQAIIKIQNQIAVQQKKPDIALPIPE